MPFAEVDEEEEDEDQEQSQMEEVPTLSGSAGEGNSAHYEYAEPVDAWYYQRGIKIFDDVCLVRFSCHVGGLS